MPPAKALKSERTHADNQERAYIAASRRSDRSLEARMESAKNASRIHKERTGRSLRVTMAAIEAEDMYEEMDDDHNGQMRTFNRMLTAGYPPEELHERLAQYLAANHEARNSIKDALLESYTRNPGVQGQSNSGFTPPISMLPTPMQNQAPQMMGSQGPQMMGNPRPQMMGSHGPQMMGNQASQMMGSRGQPIPMGSQFVAPHTSSIASQFNPHPPLQRQNSQNMSPISQSPNKNGKRPSLTIDVDTKPSFSGVKASASPTLEEYCPSASSSPLPLVSTPPSPATLARPKRPSFPAGSFSQTNIHQAVAQSSIKKQKKQPPTRKVQEIPNNLRTFSGFHVANSSNPMGLMNGIANRANDPTPINHQSAARGSSYGIFNNQMPNNVQMFSGSNVANPGHSMSFMNIMNSMNAGTQNSRDGQSINSASNPDKQAQTYPTKSGLESTLTGIVDISNLSGYSQHNTFFDEAWAPLEGNDNNLDMNEYDNNFDMNEYFDSNNDTTVS